MRLVTGFAMAIGLASVCGCTRYYADACPYGPPYSSNCVAVESQLSGAAWGPSVDWSVTWRTDSKTVDAAQVARVAAAFLSSRGKANWTESELTWRDIGDPVPLGATDAERAVDLFPVVKMIVALHPTVVVVAHEPWAGSTEVVEPQSATSVGSVFRLPRGFAYGRVIPSTASLSWFSPDLGVGPVEIAGPDDQTADIDLPWGTLLLCRTATGWLVSCRATHQ